ncbi:hypothetical protein J1614_009499 [Plenodomus biglobosus]|nr:hypothetical protein J1614_009499 [Plenodomus biglobosus]
MMSPQRSQLSQTAVSTTNSQHLAEDKGSKHNVRQLLDTVRLFCKHSVCGILDRSHHKEVEDGHLEEEKIDRDENDGDRVDWAPMRKIPDETLRKLVLQYCDPTGRIPLYCSRVEWRTSGTYNFAVCVSMYRNHKLEDFVIRIPGHGKPSSWSAEDAHNLQGEVDTMTYVKNHTNVPIPQIFGHSTTCENPLGTPFILMEGVEGKSAYHLWHDEGDDEQSEWKNADKPSPEVEEKRITFLKSLAESMSSLQDLTFNNIGLPKMFESIAESMAPYPAGPSYEFTSEQLHEPTEIAAFSTSKEYIQHGMLKSFGPQTEEEAKKDPITYGLRKVMDIVFSQAAFKPDGSTEPFTLCHNDLDLQNIIVDDDGKVKGIIDWDDAFAAPQCVGAAALPLFLRKDWCPKYRNCLTSSPYMAWNSEHYRQIYGEFLYNFSEYKEDVQFTTKSAIYCAAIEALRRGDHAMDFVGKLFREIPGLRMDKSEILIGLASDWPACEEMLDREIGKLLEPEWPKGVMDQVAQAEREEAGSTNHEGAEGESAEDGETEDMA